jgi:hypothetical protein
MKYAYIIGSNAFVVPGNVISYTGQQEEKEFLRINEIYHDPSPHHQEQPSLNCDINIRDIDGTPVTIIANKLVNASAYHIITDRDSVKVTRPDGSVLVHIHQLDEDSAMSLEHNITAELEVSMPVVAIRIFGDFKLDDLDIRAENEKLFINGDGWGNSVLAGLKRLKFTEDGVVL